jgi:hypothetical protein
MCDSLGNADWRTQLHQESGIPHLPPPLKKGIEGDLLLLLLVLEQNQSKSSVASFSTGAKRIFPIANC